MYEGRRYFNVLKNKKKTHRYTVNIKKNIYKKYLLLLLLLLFLMLMMKIKMMFYFSISSQILSFFQLAEEECSVSK